MCVIPDLIWYLLAICHDFINSQWTLRFVQSDDIN
jgi:hypothetical protein